MSVTRRDHNTKHL